MNHFEKVLQIVESLIVTVLSSIATGYIIHKTRLEIKKLKLEIKEKEKVTQNAPRKR